MFGSNSFTGALTGGLIDPSAPNYAGAAVTGEKNRKKAIQLGMQNIDSVFSGGSVPQYKLSTGTYNPAQKYFVYDNAGGYKPWKLNMPKSSVTDSAGSGAYWGTESLPLQNGLRTSGLSLGAAGAGAGAATGAMYGSVVPGIGTAIGAGLGALFGSGIFGGGGPDPKKGYANSVSKGLIYSQLPDQQFTGFGDNFYNKAGQDYVNYALPELGRQYGQAKREIGYGLANRGLTGGSANQRAISDLNMQTGQTEQGIADTARQTSQSLRTQVENARQQAINNLYQSVDPAQALQQSISSASQFRVPQSFTPITNAFSNITNQYATQQLYNSLAPGMYNNSGFDYTSPSVGALGKVTY